MDLKTCHAIVTGGASGLGAATAAAVIAAGGKATLFDRDGERGQPTAAELGSRARFRLADVTDEDDIAAAVAEAAEAFGAPTLVVNCAGIGTPGRIIGRKGVLALDTYTTVIMINLIGTFNVLKAAANVMRTNDTDDDGCRGVIVNTASVAGYEGQVGQAAYSSSKGGIIGLTLPAARDLAQYGIRVVTIAPGLFLTPMMQSLPKEAQESLAAGTPFPRRLGTAAEYGELVKTIYTNNMLNGETIRLDGAVRLAAR
ncbi:MAG: SDR family NAD(P)-dependent oxidoreductase [Alphaproteobacteria bacterium]|jgi:NAD(P)-dependent dehydrogenase (short-subunit alcohol dehydrogenase family)|nr:SDR family NAD(P)-dependent oxidoreductase [Alphaproteobacteria bacterium]MDP6515606.1 SDR family NAD(P)-dependent oxidoreductase [Alphaproteobacteria bacterium]